MIQEETPGTISEVREQITIGKVLDALQQSAEDLTYEGMKQKSYFGDTYRDILTFSVQDYGSSSRTDVFVDELKALGFAQEIPLPVEEEEGVLQKYRMVGENVAIDILFVQSSSERLEKRRLESIVDKYITGHSLIDANDRRRNVRVANLTSYTMGLAKAVREAFRGMP
jgi:hypothetical protein